MDTIKAVLELMSKLIQLPIKVTVVMLTLCSGIILMSNDSILGRLYLLEFREKYGFVIGLTFLLSVCTIVVYSATYLFTAISDGMFTERKQWKQAKRLLTLNPYELGLIYSLYSRPNYTENVNIFEPMIQGLLQRHYIYTSRMHYMSFDRYGNPTPIPVTLQPDVVSILLFLEEKADSELTRLEKKLQTEKRTEKIVKLNEEIHAIHEFKQQLR